MTIPAKTVVKFKAGKALGDEVNNLFYEADRGKVILTREKFLDTNYCLLISKLNRLECSGNHEKIL